MPQEFDIAECFQYDIWAPQCLPQDAYTEAAFYKVPSNLYWRVLDKNFNLVREPANNQDLLTIPFHTAHTDPRSFARAHGTSLLLVYLKEFGSKINWTSEFNHLESMLGSYREGPTRILSFSDGYEAFIRKKVDPKLLEGAEFYRYYPAEFDQIDPTLVLVFSSLGKVVTGGCFYGYGIALKEYDIRMCKLPVVPKTRYARVLEGNMP